MTKNNVIAVILAVFICQGAMYIKQPVITNTNPQDGNITALWGNLSADFKPLWISLNGNTTSNSSINGGNVHVTGRLSMNNSRALGRSSVSLGYNNIASGSYSIIIGGKTNTIGNSGFSAIFGGHLNSIYDSMSNDSAILGGSYNSIGAPNSFILGGIHNSIFESNAVLPRGTNIILGGNSNYINPYGGNGHDNFISGFYNAIHNTSNYSSIISGFGTKMYGYSSVASGYQIIANSDHSFSFGNDFSNDKDYSFMVGFGDATLNVTDNLVYVMGDVNTTGQVCDGAGNCVRNMLPYWVDLNGYITSNNTFNNGNVNVSGNLSVANTLTYAVPGGAYVYNIPVSTANADGKYQYFSNYSTTTPAANKGFNIRTVDDFRGGSMVAVNSVGTSLDSRIEFPATGSGPWKYRGVSNLNTMNGNYVSGFGGAWAGDFIGFQTQTDITGKLSTVAGFNMVAFNVIANITASVLPSTQLKTMKTDVYYNTPANLNQLYAWYLFLLKQNTSSTGSLYGFYTELATDGLGAINGPAAAYTAFLNPVYAANFNKSLGAGKMMNGFLVQQNNPYAMSNRETAAFHSELSQNATVYSFMSDGADGWMNKTGSMWMFGTGKGFNISFDGTQGLLSGNTLISGSLNVTNTIEVNQQHKLTSEGGNAIRVNVTDAVSRGQILKVNTSTTNMFSLASVDDDMPVCTVYDASAAANTLAWCVTDGRGYLKVSATNNLGDVCYVSASVAGSADCAATVPAITNHMREVGHAYAVNGTDGVTTGVLHWN